MKTYANLMEEALQHVPENIDKREGSIIYDALAPACYVLARYYQRLEDLIKQTFADTANGVYLDLRAKEQGIERTLATKAIRKGTFTRQNVPVDVPLSSRFETLEDKPVQFKVLEQLEHGVYRMECEEAGTIGNHYIGPLTALSPTIADKAILSDLIVPAQDTETDASLRERYFRRTKGLAWGGNILQYKELLAMQDGVGAAQIYPKWDLATFLTHPIIISVLDSEFNLPSYDFLDELQDIIQPGNGTGLVPIGHKVSFSMPTAIPIVIGLSVTPNNPTIVAKIEDSLTTYVNSVRKQWAVHDSLFQYHSVIQIANVISEIMSIDEVTNVTNVTINTFAHDLELTQTRDIQEVPFFDSVVLV